MARRALKRGSIALIAAWSLWSLPGADACAADPDAVVRQMAAQPLRYGGILRGPVDGRVLIGLDAPASDGAVHGEVLLLTTDRQLIGTGTVSGWVQAQAVPGGHDCMLNLAIPERTTTIHGVCAAARVSGEIVNRSTDRPGWLARQIFWWDGGDTRGRAWLTAAAFYD